MSRLDIEKLIYKKPNLNLGLDSLYRVHNGEIIVEPEPDPQTTEDPDNKNSTGTGGEFTNP